MATLPVAVPREGGFLDAPNAGTGPKGGPIIVATQVRCFICKRLTIERYHGGNEATKDCGVWWQGRDCWGEHCWCPQCQFALKEPDEAIHHWQSVLWNRNGLTEEKMEELMRTKWMDPAGGAQEARPLHVILQGLGPPPPPQGPAPPGLGAGPPPAPPTLGAGPPPAPQERAAIEDTSSGNRQEEEEEATRPTATPTSRDDLQSKVDDLQRAVERNEALVSDYRKFCEELEGQNQQCFKFISELTNEAKDLRKEVETYSGQMNLACQDVVTLKQQVARLEQALAWATSKNVET